MLRPCRSRARTHRLPERTLSNSILVAMNPPSQTQPPASPEKSPADSPNGVVADMSASEFRRHGQAVVDWIAEYLDAPEQWPVLPAVHPGEMRDMLPPAPPELGEPMDRILGDFRNFVVPATTHWNHPAFMAYFPNSATPAVVLGEAVTAARNVNAMH